MDRKRNSAKTIVTDYANELLRRPFNSDIRFQLLTIEVIAFRMGWNDLYGRLRFKKPLQQITDQLNDTSEYQKPEPWWQK